MIRRNWNRLLLTAASLGTAATLLIGPVAFADEGRGGGHGDNHGAAVSAIAHATTTALSADESGDRDGHGDAVSAVARLNAEANTQADQDENQNEDQDQNGNQDQGSFPVLGAYVTSLVTGGTEISSLQALSSLSSSQVRLVQVNAVADENGGQRLSTLLSNNSSSVSSLQSFLTNDTGAAATTIRTALSNAGISISSVFAVGVREDGSGVVFYQ